MAESSKERWARTEHHLAARPAAARLVWLADCGRTSLHCMVRGLRTDTPGPPRAKKRALFRPVSPAKSLRAPTPGPSGSPGDSSPSCIPGLRPPSSRAPHTHRSAPAPAPYRRRRCLWLPPRLREAPIDDATAGNTCMPSPTSQLLVIELLHVSCTRSCEDFVQRPVVVTAAAAGGLKL